MSEETSAKDEDINSLVAGQHIRLAVLPLRDIVVFPELVAPLIIGRKRSIEAVRFALKDNNGLIFLVAQKDPECNDPGVEQLYDIGTVGKIVQQVKTPDNNLKAFVEGKWRARIVGVVERDNCLEVEVCILEETNRQTEKSEVLANALLEEFAKLAKLSKRIKPEMLEVMNQIKGASRLADTLVQCLNLKQHQRQEILETTDLEKRLETLCVHIASEMSVVNLDKKIRKQIKTQMEKTQHEYYLNEQVKAIQKELGDGDNGRNELDNLEKSISELKMSEEYKEKAYSELKKLRMMSPMSAEATVIRNYLDWIISLPWNKSKRLKTSIPYAQKVLAQDHYSLDKVKERVLEHLAVQKRVRHMRGPILCLVGPPGVGKTSLAKSIARATGRPFARISLGGLRDEAEIRGHRRTYIGAMPGKIIQSLKKSKYANPLILLDEIDKVGNDWRGDPSSALLEVLDGEQNHSFNDNYLELDYDLSECMFLTTANSLNMLPALRDRLEIIRISGYTYKEKFQIAKKHLIPKQYKTLKLSKKDLVINDNAIEDLIQFYTREPGVRNLEREIANLTRKSILKLDREGDNKAIRINSRNLDVYAGIKKFKHEMKDKYDTVGQVTGLAWTENGGELLKIEAVLVPGNGNVIKTGKLGDTMQESVQAAESMVKSRAEEFGIRPALIGKHNIHVHVPEGAVPKDGPSAGIALTTAIVSLLSDIKVRKDIAMTGEITLMGNVLGIGGLKEKLLAAFMSGIEEVIIPKDNIKDLADVPDEIKEILVIHPVNHIREVLDVALVDKLVPTQWSQEEIQNAFWPQQKSIPIQPTQYSH